MAGIDGIVVSDSQGIAAALKSHWSPTFTACHSDFSPSSANDFLAEWGLRWNLEEVAPPCFDDVAWCAKKAKQSAPGPDGLPYIAWKCGGDEATNTLLSLARVASLGRCPLGMNYQSLIFVAEGSARCGG